MKKAAIYNLTWDALGGGERYTASFAKLLEEQGNYDVEIWWPNDLRKKINDRFGIDLETTHFVPNPLKGVSFLKKLQITSGYDLVFWVSDGSVPLSLARKNLVHFQIPFTVTSIANKMKAKAVTAICNSMFTKKFIDATFGINSVVVYPPVNIAAFQPSKKENLIVSVGRLSRQLHAKRQDVLIDAFAALHTKLPAWKLVLAGGSQDIEYYKSLLDRSRGLPVKIIANPKLGQIKELLGKAKIFWSATGFDVNTEVEPEKAEHFGITPVEAMAAGAVPLVVAAGGHLETVLHRKTGYHWTNIEELVDFTYEIATNYRKWGIMSKKCQVRSKIFNIENFNQSWFRFL